MKKIGRILGLAAVAAASMLATSCIMYHPQAVDVPLIHEKNQLEIDGGVSFNTLPPIISPSLGVTASYGATDWLAVQAHFGYSGNKSFYTQAAVGGYLPYEKFVFEGYLGYGFGHSYGDNDKKNGGRQEVQGNYHLPFAQVDAGWASLADGHIDVGLGMKVGLYMPDMTDITYDADGGIKDRSLYTANSCLLEPQIFFRGGGKHLKASLRVGYCQFFGKGEGGEEYVPFKGIDATYAPISATLGITYSFKPGHKE